MHTGNVAKRFVDAVLIVSYEVHQCSVDAVLLNEVDGVVVSRNAEEPGDVLVSDRFPHAHQCLLHLPVHVEYLRDTQRSYRHLVYVPASDLLWIFFLAGRLLQVPRNGLMVQQTLL